MLARVIVLGCAIVIVTSCGEAERENADLSFSFKCATRANPALEEKLVGFLAGHGFEVLNLAAIQRTRGVAINDLYITGLDSRHRIIDILAFTHDPGTQVLALTSEPPTHHDAQLEQALLDFTSVGIGCTTSRIIRRENDSSALKLHAWNVRRIQGLLKEANELGNNGT